MIKYRTCTVIIVDDVKGGIKSILKIDSRKYDNIGCSKQSLAKYVKTLISESDVFFITNDRIYE